MVLVIFVTGHQPKAGGLCFAARHPLLTYLPFMKTVIFLLLICFTATAFAQHRNDYWVAYTDTGTEDQLVGYKKADGSIALPAKYLWVATDTFYTMAIVFDQGWAGINREGKVILRPFIFDNGPDDVSEGLFRFEENERIGFADLTGTKVISARYGFAEPFSEGLAAYTKGGHKQYDQGGEHWWWTGGDETGYVNKAGQEFARAGVLKNKQREAWTRDGKHVLLDSQGNVIKSK